MCDLEKIYDDEWSKSEEKFDSNENTISYKSYNEDGELDWEEKYEYDSNGYLTKRQDWSNWYGSGWSGWCYYEHQFGYDSNGNLLYEHSYNPDGTVEYKYEYNYTDINVPKK